jgi:hypothetical protein
MRRGVDVQQAPAPHFERHKDIQNAKCRGHHDTEVAAHECLRVIAREHCPALPGCTEWLSSTATLAAHVPADRARRDANPELGEQFRRNPFFALGDVAPGDGGDHPLELGRQRWASRVRPPAAEEAEGLPVPAEERAWLDDYERLPHAKPRASRTSVSRSGSDACRGFTSRSRYRASRLRRHRFSAAKAVRERRMPPTNRTRSNARAAITQPTWTYHYMPRMTAPPSRHIGIVGGLRFENGESTSTEYKADGLFVHYTGPNRAIPRCAGASAGRTSAPAVHSGRGELDSLWTPS